MMPGSDHEDRHGRGGGGAARVGPSVRDEGRHGRARRIRACFAAIWSSSAAAIPSISERSDTARAPCGRWRARCAMPASRESKAASSATTICSTTTGSATDGRSTTCRTAIRRRSARSMYNEGSVDLVIRAGAAAGDPVAIQVRPEGSGLADRQQTGDGRRDRHRRADVAAPPGFVARRRSRDRFPRRPRRSRARRRSTTPRRFSRRRFALALIAEGVQVGGDAIDIDDFAGEARPARSARTLAAASRRRFASLRRR